VQSGQQLVLAGGRRARGAGGEGGGEALARRQRVDLCKTVQLRKVTKGDVKRHKVYVNSGRKDAQGRVIAKKIEFGSEKGSKLRVRKADAARRKNFAARHRCHTANDPKTARYWSCRAPSSKIKGGYW